MKKKKGKKRYSSYLEFLEAAVASENLRKNDPEKWAEQKKKLEKERLLAKLGLRRNLES